MVANLFRKFEPSPSTPPSDTARFVFDHARSPGLCGFAKPWKVARVTWESVGNPEAVLKVFSMSMEQWATFKAMFPSPGRLSGNVLLDLWGCNFSTPHDANSLVRHLCRRLQACDSQIPDRGYYCTWCF